jgi:hypothetical protein
MTKFILEQRHSSGTRPDLTTLQQEGTYLKRRGCSVIDSQMPTIISVREPGRQLQMPPPSCPVPRPTQQRGAWRCVCGVNESNTWSGGNSAADFCNELPTPNQPTPALVRPLERRMSRFPHPHPARETQRRSDSICARSGYRGRPRRWDFLRASAVS